MKRSGTLDFGAAARLLDARGRSGRRKSVWSILKRSTGFLPAWRSVPSGLHRWRCGTRTMRSISCKCPMLRLAQSYGHRPAEEWKPLFYRILYNGIRDSQRRSSVRSRIFSLWPGNLRPDEDGPNDPFENISDGAPDPSERLMASEAMQRLERAIGALPARSVRRSRFAVSRVWTWRRPPPRWVVPRAASRHIISAPSGRCVRSLVMRGDRHERADD